MAAEGASRGGAAAQATAAPIWVRFCSGAVASMAAALALPSSGQSTPGSRLLGDFIEKMFGA